MRLVRQILLRLLYGAVSLVFICFVTFAAQGLAPGDAATALAGEKATPEQVVALRHQMGLDRPFGVQFVTFLANAARGDLGNSYFGQQQPVAKIVRDNLPCTATVAFSAMLLASAVGILLGTLAAVYQNKFADRVVLTVGTVGVTVPNFVLAPILVYIFALKLDQLPQTWEVPLRDAAWKYLLLPVVILAARPMALLTRLTRASMIETLNQEFIRTAVAKGVPPLRLYFRHALRNAILPVVTAIGTSFGFLLTGSFVIERFFRLPGIGARTIEAIQRRDTPVIQGGILVTGALFILVNLAVDVLLPILDPRIREAQV
ncbi:MAG: ABC transporter permease [Fimbriimonadaceae bacterium]